MGKLGVVCAIFFCMTVKFRMALTSTWCTLGAGFFHVSDLRDLSESIRAVAFARMNQRSMFLKQEFDQRMADVRNGRPNSRLPRGLRHRVAPSRVAISPVAVEGPSGADADSSEEDSDGDGHCQGDLVKSGSNGEDDGGGDDADDIFDFLRKRISEFSDFRCVYVLFFCCILQVLCFVADLFPYCCRPKGAEFTSWLVKREVENLRQLANLSSFFRFFRFVGFALGGVTIYTQGFGALADRHFLFFLLGTMSFIFVLFNMFYKFTVDAGDSLRNGRTWFVYLPTMDDDAVPEDAMPSASVVR